LLSLALLPISVSAWTGTGHMITAQIAYWELTEEARQEVDRLIALLADFAPRSDHAVSASLWMDDLKATGLRAMNTWHYINIPYNAGGLSALPAAKDENVIWAIGQAEDTLSHSRATDFNKAFMLRVLLHLVGDIHQPLHSVGRCTQAHPDGDRGGNDFRILDGAEDIALHYYWDRSADLFPRVQVESWRSEIPQLARRLKRRIPKGSLPASQEGDPAEWARESFRLARSHVYSGIEENAPPSESYTAQAQSIIAERLALGGYRLGAMLNRLLGTQGNEEPGQQPGSSP
jgi:hypothetical protein